MSDTAAADADATPGSASSSSCIRANVATRCVKSWPLRAGSTSNASSRSGLKPGSSARRFIRLRVKRPAPISSSSESATCATTSPLRSRKCPAPPTTAVASLLSAGARSARLARIAGTSPKPTPVSTASPSVKSPTRRSGAADSVRVASWYGSARISASPTQ